MNGSSHFPKLSRSFGEAAATRQRKQSQRRKCPPFSLRLTPEERQHLDELAGQQSVGAYIREQVFGDNQEKRRRSRRPAPDTHQLALVLAELGKSRLSSNINQLAKAANMGTLEMAPEVRHQIETACQEIQTMRMLLVAALGVKSEAGE